MSSSAIQQPPRVVAIDVYRGLVMLLMMAEVMRLHAVAASRWHGGQPQSYEAVVVRHAYALPDSVAHVQNVLSSARGESIGGADFTPFDGLTRRCYLRPLVR